MKIVTINDINKIDQELIKTQYISNQKLMLKAGNESGKIILNYLKYHIKPHHIKQFILLIGNGNNGGDACVIANYLNKYTNKKIILYSINEFDKLNKLTRYYIKLLYNNDNIQINKIDQINIKNNLNTPGNIIIDGLLGTGFIGKLQPKYKKIINIINSLNLPTISIDIPSGLNGDNGIVEDVAITADLTVTIGLPKLGLLIKDGLKYIGKLEIANLNIPKEIIEKIQSKYYLFTNKLANKLIYRKPFNCNKKSTGKILIIGGSKFYTGAPFISAEAALRAGAGFVTVAIPGSISISNTINLSIIIRRIDDNNIGIFGNDSIKEIISLIKQHDTIILGPGLGNYKISNKFVKKILSFKKQTIIDADAINIIAKTPSILPISKKFIFTPHTQEMIRLLKAFNLNALINYDRIEQALKLIKIISGTIVAKGNKTAILNKENDNIYINISGSQSLAVAGSGDILSGIISAIVNYNNITQFNAICLSVYIHGLTVTYNYNKIKSRGITINDMLNNIPIILNDISPMA